MNLENSTAAHAFRHILFPLRVFGLIPAGRAKRSTWPLIPLLIYVTFWIIVTSRLSIRVNFRLRSVFHLQKLAIDLCTYGMLTVTIWITVKSLTKQKEFFKYLVIISKVDKDLNEVGQPSSGNYKQLERTVVSALAFTIVLYVVMAVVSTTILKSNSATSGQLNITMMIITTVSSQTFSCYMIFYAVSLRSISFRYMRLNTCLKKRFQNDVRFNSFTQYNLVKRLSSIYDDLANLTDLLNDLCTFPVALYTVLNFVFLVFTCFRAIHSLKDPTKMAFDSLTVLWCIYLQCFVWPSIHMANQLIEQVNVFVIYFMSFLKYFFNLLLSILSPFPSKHTVYTVPYLLYRHLWSVLRVSKFREIYMHI